MIACVRLLFISITCFIFQSNICSKALVDLEKNSQDFVLETKQIKIPGFSGAFNPSIVRWHDSLIMSFRVRDPRMRSTFEIGMVLLNENFEPISTPRLLQIRQQASSYGQIQDPRLININERLYILYSNFIKIDGVFTRRMFVAEVHYENNRFLIIDPICLRSFEGSSSRWEKNWVPINANGNLLLAYSILPHRILLPSLRLGTCKTINSTRSSIHWPWGELRGGTPALLDGAEYLAFFHSSKNMSSVHSNGKDVTHYFMGAYTFSPQQPFEITRISPEPIVGKNFYNGPDYPTWKPIRAIFPCGYIADENYLWVVYGRQDFECWVVKMDKQGLYDSLIPCARSEQLSKHGPRFITQQS